LKEIKMKKILYLLLAAIMLVGIVAACGDDAPAPAATPAGDTETAAPADGERQTINVWSFTDEIPYAAQRFTELNPDFPYDINITIIATDGGAYQTALDQALIAGGASAPDIYTAEASFVLKYTQGEASSWAKPYRDFGIDIDSRIRQAEIATYIVDLGTNPDGDVVALAFQNTGSGLIYRRSIAIEVWGTDDPAEIANITGPGWDKYLAAAAELHAAGFAIASGEGDLWQVIRNTATQPYVVDGRLHLDPMREVYFDVAKAVIEGVFTNRSPSWNDP
jgi:ABC-type glycerol-3-phosphate transport system substrate-binding protein